MNGLDSRSNSWVALSPDIERFRHIRERSADYIFLSCKGQICQANHHATQAMPPRGREATVPSSQPSLPTNRVFVVQFGAPPAGAASSYAGRVEHLVSGQAARFHSLEVLVGFMVGVLADLEEPSDAP
jgi:hypothetical protein